MYSVGNFYIARFTLPFNYITKKGKSVKKEWLMIEGVPCKVVDNRENYVILNSFTSSSDRNFEIHNTKMKDLFDETFIIDKAIYAPKYPFPIMLDEFEKRNDAKKLENKLRDMTNNLECDKTVKTIINDKLFQLIQSQGAPYITIEEYEKFKKNETILSKHERFGKEIFNRNCRWCPPIDITYDEYTQSLSYPAPLGIRPKDFCLPSELIETITEMINQIYNMKNIDKESFRDLLPILEKRNFHKCKYCGLCVDANEYSSVYKSETNFMEICHRDPNERFLKKNMYWGHGECNRKQGGYSEYQRKKDGLHLMYLNNEINEDEYEALKEKIKLN